MNVRELKKLLESLDEDLEVITWDPYYDCPTNTVIVTEAHDDKSNVVVRISNF